MATNATSKIDAATEKAYAEASEKKAAAKPIVNEKAVEKAVMADAPKAPVKAKAVKKAVAAPAKKPAAKKAPAKKVAAKKAPVRKATVKAAPKKTATKTAAKPAAKRAPKKVAAKVGTNNPVSKLKDSIMANAKTTDFTKTAKEMAADVQGRMKTAFAKTGELASEVGDFNKGNVEAVVESGKIFFAGVQDMGREQVATGKAVVETVTADVKKMTTVKSPTELMQLQGELARRNFDAVVSFSSKNTEALVKLYSDAFAPISNRVSVATEKFSKAA